MTEQKKLEAEIKVVTPKLAEQLPHLKTMVQNLATHTAIARHGDPELEETRKNLLHILQGLIRFSQTNLHNTELLYKLNKDVENLVKLMREELKGLVQLHEIVSKFTFHNSRQEVPKMGAIIERLGKIYPTEVQIVQSFDTEAKNAA